MKPDHEVVIVGAGFAGIGAGVELKRAGIDDFVMLEAAGDIGGTWRDNDYPGLTVDIPSPAYQFSWEKNADWSRFFAPGAELKAYADDCIDKHGLRSHVRLNHKVTKGHFDEDNHLWRLHLGRKVIKARYVFAATGGFGDPKYPDIEGLDGFEGKSFHTVHWDHDYDLSGKRVAVIGTGATAVQMVPEVAQEVERLYVFQRTPIWVAPKPDFAWPGLAKFLMRHVPLTQTALRAVGVGAVEAGMVGNIYFRYINFAPRLLEAGIKAFIRQQVPDPVLREKLTPTYGFGCKRPSVSNVWYSTFNRANTDLITDPIECITPNGIRTVGGVEREIDALILATGFKTTEPENAPKVPVYGRDGFDLRRFWNEERFQAYEGVSVPKLPNAFAIFGPYSFTGTSWMFMVENQAHHAVRVVKEARRRAATFVEVRQEAHDEFFRHILGRQRNTIFFHNNCSGANSYYFDHHGDAPFVRPSTGLEATWRARRFDLDHYRYDTLGTEAADPGARGDLEAVGA